MPWARHPATVHLLCLHEEVKDGVKRWGSRRILRGIYARAGDRESDLEYKDLKSNLFVCF